MKPEKLFQISKIIFENQKAFILMKDGEELICKDCSFGENEYNVPDLLIVTTNDRYVIIQDADIEKVEVYKK